MKNLAGYLIHTITTSTFPVDPHSKGNTGSTAFVRSTRALVVTNPQGSLIGEAALHYYDLERVANVHGDHLEKPDFGFLDVVLGRAACLFAPAGQWWADGVCSLIPDIAALNLLVIKEASITRSEHRDILPSVIERLIEREGAGAGIVAVHADRKDARRKYAKMDFMPYDNGLMIRSR